MNIPIFLEESLKIGSSFSPFTSMSLERISRYVKASRLEFFPEYTDHGAEHIELTLQTAVDLMTDESRGLISPADAAVLAVAVGLHDFGMHLTKDGFESLIKSNSLWTPISGLDSKPWDELWDAFFAEAKRFDGRKLRALFGENYQPVNPLPLKGDNWGDFDKLLVGEFLRRHHPRLAHEIAIYGFPGKNGEAVTVCPKHSFEDEFLADMAGLVARSHGMNLRDCIPYLEIKYRNKVDYRRVHAIYLMVLIRLADYFQIQSSRAPCERTEVDSFYSGFSEREWRLHQCVDDINMTGEDPEALVIDASPENVCTFLKLKNWQIGLQKELDMSWAVIGEVYGRQSNNGLNNFGVKIRRVKSNLDNIDDFSMSVDYLPKKISFESANTDLLKLLVGPLYGNDLSFGIRELVQNSVDAVLELKEFLSRFPKIKSVDTYEQNGDVLILFECDEKGVPKKIVFTDKGIGMTPDVVQEYFLKAGASFRKSDAWRRAFEDSGGQSKVLRTGRFGVGVLAAFLLGDELEVTTRHVTQYGGHGVTFKVSVESDAIEIKKIKCPVGTKISIIIPKKLQSYAKIFVPNSWTKYLSDTDCAQYFLKFPSVKIEFSHLKNSLSYEWFLPQPDASASYPWREVDHDEYGKIFWTYDNSFPKFSCNGFPIGGSMDSVTINSPISYLKFPCVSMFDRNGSLPINLQRTSLKSSELPFQKQLYESITDDIIAHALTSSLESCTGNWLHGRHASFEGWFVCNGYNYERHQTCWSREYPQWLICKKGFILNDPHLIKEFNPKNVIFVVGGGRGYNGWGDIFRDMLSEDTIISYSCSGALYRRVKGEFKNCMGLNSPLSFLVFDGGRLFISKTVFDKINFNPGKAIIKLLPRLNELNSNPDWFFAAHRDCGNNYLEIEKIIRHLPPDMKNSIMINALHVKRIGPIKDSDLVARRWMQILGTPVIPFDAKEREGLEHRASKYIEKHLVLNRESLRVIKEKLKDD